MKLLAESKVNKNSARAVFFLVAFFLFNVSSAYAKNIYVDNRNLNNSCSDAYTYAENSEAKPFCAIQRAANLVQAGDIVKVSPGKYNSFDVLVKNGNASSPIVFEGTLGSNNEKLTIVDPYKEITGWAKDLNFDPQGRVYSTTSIGYEPYAMYIAVDNVPYKIQKLCPSRMGTQCESWSSQLLRDKNYLWDGVVNYWDGIEAHFYADSGKTYVRFRDGDDPRQYSMFSAPEMAGIGIYGSSYIEVNNFEVRAANTGIQASAAFGGGPNEIASSNIKINNNKVVVGRRAIMASGGGHAISNNFATAQSYARLIGGLSWGSWISSPGEVLTYKMQVNRHMVHHHKYVSHNGDQSFESGGIELVGGSGSKVFGNEVSEKMALFGVSSYDNYEVYDNYLHNSASVGIFVDSRRSGLSSIHDNLLLETNDAFRLGDFNDGKGNVRIYKNKVWQEQGAGRHAFFHHEPPCDDQEDNDGDGKCDYDGCGWGDANTIDDGCQALAGCSGCTAQLDFNEIPNDYYTPTKLGSSSNVWFYHNSFVGGTMFVQINGIDKWSWDGMKNVYFINNIVSVPKFDGGTSPQTIYRPPGFVGRCSNNWIFNNSFPTWCDNTNIKSASLMWDTPTPPDFTPSDDAVINSGIVLDQPGMTPEFYGDGLPDMGAVQMATLNSADVNQDGHINIKDIQEVIRCIINSSCGVPRADVNGDGKVNIKDIQEIIRKILNP